MIIQARVRNCIDQLTFGFQVRLSVAYNLGQI